MCAVTLSNISIDLVLFAGLCMGSNKQDDYNKAKKMKMYGLNSKGITVKHAQYC